MRLKKSKNETGTGTLSLESREDSSEGVKRGDYFSTIQAYHPQN